MKLTLLLALLLATTVTTANAQNYPITRVIDGDTVAFEAKFLPKPLKPELLLRVYGVDTPEKGYRAECSREDLKSQEATIFTTSFIKTAKNVSINIQEWDKYGGRVLGDIVADGKSLRHALLENNLAREYYGDKKESWCK
jgi:endonuclease YncB( thermonuclease family)